jgi:LPS export ABC transporter protein LptC/lipopolysaccharide transport protein LptA
MKAVVLVIIFILSSTWVFAEDVSLNGKAVRDVPAQQLEGFNLSGYSDGGQKSWDIKGDKADVQGNEVAVTNVNANSYGEQDLNLTAKKGKIDKATGDVNLEQDVVVTSDSGTTLRTDTLQWQRNKDLVQTDDKVSIEDGTMTVQGKGMEAHPSLKDAKLRGDVTANIMAEGKDKKKDNQIQITSDGPMEIDQASQTAVFTENVQALEMSTGRKLKADRMEVTFDQDSRKIKQILCTGNVEVHQGMNITYSDSLTYKADEQRMILTGKPKLIIDPGDRTSEDMLNY